MGVSDQLKYLYRQYKILKEDIRADKTISRHRRHEELSFRNPRRLAIARSFSLSLEQKRQVDELFLNNYGEKVDYIWHQNYAAHSGRFDPYFFPELLYIPEFEAFQNHNKSAINSFSDKNLLPLLAKAASVNMPETIVSCTGGCLRDSDYSIISPVMATELVKRQGDCFIKPTIDSSSGRGCMVLKEGDDFVFSHNSLKVNDNVFYLNDFTVQKIITCHSSISAIYPNSVNTFRIITYLWKGQVEFMPIIIRIGQGGHFLDNAHQGGMFCAVNNDGTMGDHAVTEFNDQFSEHPDTHLVFANHKIDYIDRVIFSAKMMHEKMCQLGVINWDFTIDVNGSPLLIEANCKGGSVWLPQMAHGVGAFGARTPEVLRWLRFMKNTKAHDRQHYTYGYME